MQNKNSELSFLLAYSYSKLEVATVDDDWWIIFRNLWCYNKSSKTLLVIVGIKIRTRQEYMLFSVVKEFCDEEFFLLCSWRHVWTHSLLFPTRTYATYIHAQTYMTKKLVEKRIIQNTDNGFKNYISSQYFGLSTFPFNYSHLVGLTKSTISL